MNVVPRVRKSVELAFRRNIGVASVLAQKGTATDAIQKLFIQMVKEYDQKSKAAQGKLVDPNPQIEKELKSELERVAKIYGGQAGTDMTKFPTFNFKDPVYDPINAQA